MHVVVVGNPGAGKSTLLNTLIGRAVFSSGVSFREGNTREATTFAHEFDKYTDTPGLADMSSKSEATSEIQKGLNEGTDITLAFVLTLDSGRLRMADLATIKLVIDSFERKRVPVAGRYVIVINRVSLVMMQKVAREFGNSRQNLINKYFTSNNLSPPYDVHLVHNDPDGDDKDNYLLNIGREDLKTFLEEAPPISVGRKKIKLPTNAWQRYMRDLGKTLCEISDKTLDMICRTS